jgi:hypothetical protein
VSGLATSSAGDWSVPLNGLQLERLSTALVNQFAVLYDVENTVDPRLSFTDGMLTFAFKGGFSEQDKDRLATGRGDEFREFRERFLRAVAEEMNEVVESVVPTVQVTFFSAAFDTSSHLTYCFFVLDRSVDTEREQREAIRAWSEQVRLHARKLRARSSHARKANAPIVRSFAELRRKSHRG